MHSESTIILVTADGFVAPGARGEWRFPAQTTTKLSKIIVQDITPINERFVSFSCAMLHTSVVHSRSNRVNQSAPSLSHHAMCCTGRDAIPVFWNTSFTQYPSTIAITGSSSRNCHYSLSTTLSHYRGKPRNKTAWPKAAHLFNQYPIPTRSTDWLKAIIRHRRHGHPLLPHAHRPGRTRGLPRCRMYDNRPASPYMEWEGWHISNRRSSRN